MRRTWIFLIIILMIVHPPIAQAQSEGWNSDCDSAARTAIADTTSALDYTTACQLYTTCQNAGGDFALCHMSALMSLESACEAEDGLCLTRSQLYAAVMIVPDTNYASPFTLENLTQLPPILLSALTHFEAGDYDAALAELESITEDISYHPLLKIMAGLISEANGDASQALAYYDAAVSRATIYPMVYYVRGNFFAQQGQIEQAAADFANFSHYVSGDADLLDAAETLTREYPIESIPFEAWTVYSVLMSGGNPGGGWAVDLSLYEPYPIQVARVEDDTRLITQRVGEFLHNDLGTDTPLYVNFQVQEDGSYHFEQIYTDDYGEWGSRVTLNFASQPATASESQLVFESTASLNYLLAPADAPDPRPFLAATRCEGGVLSRLVIGETGFTKGYEDTPLYDSPAGQTTESAIPGFSSFTVLEGPACVEGQAWWRVENAENTSLMGWLPENTDEEYLLLNFDAPDIPPLCEVTLQPRLFSGSMASVIAGQGANQLREAPAIDAPSIGTLPEGSTFEVLAGPICADGYAWYQVKIGDVVGWTAEASEEAYWLQPE